MNVGDVVQLKSGGPYMTINEINQDDIYCVWFDKTEQKFGKFKRATLAIYEG